MCKNRKKLTDQKIRENRHQIIDLLLSTNRKGIHKVIEYLDCSGFFTAPSSVNRHHNWTGGLAQHSLGVYTSAVRLNQGESSSSIILAALLHDLCKARRFYINLKGELSVRPVHIKGHGRRSSILLQKMHLNLYGNERRAIRWHMGGHHTQSTEEMKDARMAGLEHLSWLIRKADYLDAAGYNLSD